MTIWNEKTLSELPIGSSEYFKAQAQVIKSKSLVKRNYDMWYQKIKAEIDTININNGLIVELGSGGGYIKDFIPETITTDLEGAHVDMEVNAQRMPFQDESVKTLILTHSFHHFPDPEAFFREANRVLKPGGKILFIEVTSTLFSQFVFKVAGDEPIDTSQKEWSFKQVNAMDDANQALSWIIFDRDKDKFNKLFPRLKIEKKENLPWCTYLMSGGVTRRPFIPETLFPFAEFIDNIKFLRSIFSIHWFIALGKEK